MSSSDFVDLTEDPGFRKEDWMGKIYPTVDVPADLQEFCNAALEIPAAHRSTLLPNTTLSVNAFVELSLPTAQATLISIRAETCFINAKPTNDVSCLKTRKLPSLEFVEDAEKHIGQALLNGAQSIEDPAFKGEGLPFWTIQFWKEMHRTAEAQSIWKRSICWLEKINTGMGEQGELTQTRKHLSSLAWRAQALVPASSTGLATLDFARLLSNQMLTTSLVDIMVEHIAGWVGHDEVLSEKFEVVTLVFMHEIEKAKGEDYYEKKSPTYLHKLEERLRGSDKSLLFPVHLPRRIHFIAFEINFRTQTILYGELALVISALPLRAECLPQATR
jgi:hypothetical protein